MARFDLYRGESGSYLLDVQTDLVWGLGTRLVVPLLPAEASPQAMRRLHPVFEVENSQFVMATHLLAAVPEKSLGTAIGTLDAHYDEIVAALDMIFVGF